MTSAFTLVDIDADRALVVLDGVPFAIVQKADPDRDEDYPTPVGTVYPVEVRSDRDFLSPRLLGSRVVTSFAHHLVADDIDPQTIAAAVRCDA